MHPLLVWDVAQRLTYDLWEPEFNLTLLKNMKGSLGGVCWEGWWRYTFSQSIFFISVCLWLLAGVKMWLTSDVRHCAHSWLSIKHSWNLLQNILYNLFFFFKNNLYIWWSWEADYWTRATSWLKHIKYVLKC